MREINRCDASYEGVSNINWLIFLMLLLPHRYFLYCQKWQCVIRIWYDELNLENWEKRAKKWVSSAKNENKKKIIVAKLSLILWSNGYTMFVDCECDMRFPTPLWLLPCRGCTKLSDPKVAPDGNHSVFLLAWSRSYSSFMKWLR